MCGHRVHDNIHDSRRAQLKCRLFTGTYTRQSNNICISGIIYKDLGQSPIQILKACGWDNALFTTNCLCLNQTLTFNAPSRIKVFGKYCILMPGRLHGVRGGGIFCDHILFHTKSRFRQVLT